MNALLHRHCAKYIYVLPDGLRELMSDISREVLRSQPEQMYTFIADYLDALMITRENARVAARLVECITEIGVTIVELLTKTGITRADANKAAAIIQVAFRRHLEYKREFQLKQLNLTKEEEEEFFTKQIIEQCRISHDKADEAAHIIQDAYRRFRQHEKVEHDLLLGMIDWRVAARSAIYLYRKTGVSMYEANRAATLIKAAYKGYYTRQVMRRLVEEGHQAFNMELEKVSEEITDGDEGTEDEQVEEEEYNFTIDDNNYFGETMDDMELAKGMFENIAHSFEEEESPDDDLVTFMKYKEDDNQTVDSNVDRQAEKDVEHEEANNVDKPTGDPEHTGANNAEKATEDVEHEEANNVEKATGGPEHAEETAVDVSQHLDSKKPDKSTADDSIAIAADGQPTATDPTEKTEVTEHLREGQTTDETTE